ncbi:MAG: autotransporter domain-containing protein [Sphingobium phenoxybenzoativorans]
MNRNKVRLSTGIMSGAVVFALAHPSIAEAACATDPNTVTCTAAGNTASSVNTAVGSITPPNVSLVLSAGSTVVDDGPGAIIVGPAYTGAVTFTNGGIVGTNVNPVDFRYTGDTATATNSFTGINSAGAEIFGDVLVDSVGGATSFQNAGTVTGRIDLSGQGAVSTAIDGIVTRDVDLRSALGDSSVTLTGEAREGVSAISRGTNGSVSTYTITGGTASIVIQSSAAMTAAQTPAVVSGEIYAMGRAGSSVSISAGSRVLTNPGLGGTIGLDGLSADLYDITQSATSDPSGTGSATSNYFARAVGGPSTFTNAGIVGGASATLTGGYYDAPVEVYVDSATQSTATNSGTIYGDVAVYALGGTYSRVIQSTGTNNPPTQVDQTTEVYVKTAAPASFVNSGLVGGNATMTATQGTATNSGVIRGGVYLGSSAQHYTAVDNVIIALGATPLVQTYTLAQNGFVGGADGGNAILVRGAIEGSSYGIDSALIPNGGPLISNTIVATLNLNAGSVTVGNVSAEHDAATGARYTQTTLNLNGNGYLGLSNADGARQQESAAALAPFAATDPLLNTADVASTLSGASFRTAGSRILVVDTVAKTGTGTFVINGAAFVPGGSPTWTMDVGNFAINQGAVQLDVNGGSNLFGIRGNVSNGATLVVGRLQSANANGIATVDGISAYVRGNFAQSASGTLVMGVTPVVQTSGTAGGTALAQVVPAITPGFVYSSPSFITVDGNLSLAGTVNVVTGSNGRFIAGTRADLFDVSGSVGVTADAIANGVNSPFLDLIFRERAGAPGRTIVSVEVQRQSYATDAADLNVVAVGHALDAILPTVFARLEDPAFTGNPANAAAVSNLQDMADVLNALDAQLDEDQIAEAMQELASGEFYGSIAAIRTTDPFGDFTRYLPRAMGKGGLNIWLSPNGNFVRYGRNVPYGASATRTQNYGGSVGVGTTTAGGVSLGLGFGYGDIDINARRTPERADANTYMVGGFAQGPVGAMNMGLQVVYGWSDWTVSRPMPLLGRTGQAKFDSTELRILGEISHVFDLGGMDIAPFLRGDVRHYSFDGFTETGAGGIGLIVEKRSHTYFSPEVGARLVGNMESSGATLHPEASVSYTLHGGVGGSRDMAFIADPTTIFRLQGSDPDAFWTFGAGLAAEIGSKTAAFARGFYSTGGGQQGAAFNVGIRVGF